MANDPQRPRDSIDGRIAKLEQALREQRLQHEVARQDLLHGARHTAPEIRRKRKTMNWAIVGVAVLLLGLIAYFVFRPAPEAGRSGLEDDGWALPGVEPLPDAPDLPDLEKLQQAGKQRTGGGKRRVKTAAPDILDFDLDDTTDPTGGMRPE